MKLPALRPTTRGAAALGSFGLVAVAAFVTGTPELAPLAVVIGLPLALSPWLAHRRGRHATESLEFHAHIEPGAVEAGTEMQVRLSVTNRSTGGPAVPSLALPHVEQHWRVHGADTGTASRHRWMAPSVPSLLVLPHPGPLRTESCTLDVPTGRRGVFKLPPQQSWVHDPLGLFGAPGPVTPAIIAVVHPVPIRPSQPIVGIPATLVGAASAANSGSGRGLGELEGIRPYVAGDRLSLLHWPAKARYGTWFVRQFGAEGTAALSLVLDDRAGVHRRDDFERLVSTALWTVIETTQSGRAVLLSTLSGRIHSLEPTERGKAKARLALAMMQPVALGTSARFPAIPADALVLTTQTGVERLVVRSPATGPLDEFGDRAAPIGRATRVVVV